MTTNEFVNHNSNRQMSGPLSVMKKSSGLLLVLGFLCLPAKAHANPVPQPSGSLIVYSRTEETHWGDGAAYYPHSSYWIYNAAGKRIQTVENHISTIDEAPERVSLAPGSYTIRAWSDNDGLVTLPVVIKPIEVTHVNLEKERVTAKETVASRKTVSVPSAHVTACKA